MGEGGDFRILGTRYKTRLGMNENVRLQFGDNFGKKVYFWFATNTKLCVQQRFLFDTTFIKNYFVPTVTTVPCGETFETQSNCLCQVRGSLLNYTTVLWSVDKTNERLYSLQMKNSAA